MGRGSVSDITVGPSTLRPRQAGPGRRRAAERGSCAALSGLIALACVQELPRKRADEAPPPVAVWELSEEPPKASVSLWPRGPGTPERKKRQVVTEGVDGRLEAKTEGTDPCFLWRFATPIQVAAFRVDVVAQDAGRLQLFWSTPKCPVFSEACSASQMLERGQNVVAFLLDPSAPVRELRLDLPETPGARLAFTSVTSSPEPHLDTAWVGRDTTQVSVDSTGLALATSETDPWLVVETPGLDAARVGSIEVTVSGPSGPPQLFWDGPCGSFTEACSVLLERVDAGATSHRASLTSNTSNTSNTPNAPNTRSEWRGAIRRLRLDPGPGPGEYRIERVVLGARPSP